MGILLSAAVVVPEIPAEAAGSGGWSDLSLHVVGGPVASNGMIIVLNVGSTHKLELSAVDPSSGSIAWSHPFSASQITPGVAFSPVVIGRTVLDLLPARAADNPAVTVEGIDAVSGRYLWKLPEKIVLSDAPVECAAGRYFCLPGFASATTTDLIALNPSSGAGEGAVQGPLRNMAVAPPGSVNNSSLWQTDASVPTLMQLSDTGQEAWTRPVADLFGGSQFDPNSGWDFLVTGPLDIGSVGVTPTGNTEQLGAFKTIGISISTGAIAWSTPGYFLCGGGLQFLSVDVVCKYAGAARIKGESESLTGVQLALEGIDPSSGAITWSENVQDVRALSLGTNLAFRDGSHMVVQTLAGKRVLLNMKDGSTSPVVSGEVFWCEQVPYYKVTAPPGASAGGKRASEPVFRACSAKGARVDGRPATDPSIVGLHLDGLFIWPAPTGLQAVRSVR